MQIKMNGNLQRRKTEEHPHSPRERSSLKSANRAVSFVLVLALVLGLFTPQWGGIENGFVEKAYAAPAGTKASVSINGVVTDIASGGKTLSVTPADSITLTIEKDNGNANPTFTIELAEGLMWTALPADGLSNVISAVWDASTAIDYPNYNSIETYKNPDTGTTTAAGGPYKSNCGKVVVKLKSDTRKVSANLNFKVDPYLAKFSDYTLANAIKIKYSDDSNPEAEIAAANVAVVPAINPRIEGFVSLQPSINAENKVTCNLLSRLYDTDGYRLVSNVEMIIQAPEGVVFESSFLDFTPVGPVTGTAMYMYKASKSNLIWRYGDKRIGICRFIIRCPPQK